MAIPPEDLDTAVAPEAAGPNRIRLVLIAAGGFTLLVLLWFVFLRGGEEEPLEVTAPPPAATPIESPEPEATEDDNGPLETFDVFAAKDPFEPAIDQGAGDGEETEEGTEEETGDGGTEEETEDGTTPTGGDAGGGESVGGHRVRVVDVFPRGRRAQIQVDGTVYTVREGDTFAENFQLVSASGECATMLFGDDEFTLCEGEEVLK